MHLNKEVSYRRSGFAARRLAQFIGLLVLGMAAGGAASAQDLTHRFINPSFGGNPFYSEHLLGIAGIHRPAEPEEPAEDPPTEEELLAQQLQARLLSQLSSTILDRIQDARPGDSGEFELGNQRISFTRTQTETRVVFINTTTGERREIVIPVEGRGGPFGAANALTQGSPEQALGARGTSPTGQPGVSLLSPPPL